MESRIVISFRPLEAIEVERIALDRNRDEALKMIETIMKKIKDASAPH